MRRIFHLAVLLVFTLPQARAVIVRGHVATPLGAPMPGARVQLIQGHRSVAGAICGAEGEYEIRTSFAGRFLLLTAPSMTMAGYAPQVGNSFYAGRADLVNMDVVLNHTEITRQLSAQETLVETHKAQLSTLVTQIAADEFLTHVFTTEELGQNPSAVVVQTGELGSAAFLYLRGAPPAASLAIVDGVEGNDLGGTLNLSTLSTSALASVSSDPAIELSAGANPLYLVGAEGGLLTVYSSIAGSLRPTLIYTGDAGNLGALRNEAEVELARSRFDFLGSYGRFDLANDLPRAPYHIATWATNIGYHITAGTTLRLTARDDLSAAALSSPYALFRVVPSGREAHQNLLGSATFETVATSGWHNLVRYGLARKRAETFDYRTPAFGLPVTIMGANGFTASGTAAFLPLPPREDVSTTRDEAAWQTDYEYKSWLRIVGQFRVQNERGADILPGDKIALSRTHISGAAGFNGELKHRLFYESSGFLDHTQQFGFTGAPRLGLNYAAARPGQHKLRGTTLRVSAAAGTRELSLLEEAAAPGRLQTPHSRTFETSIEQNILPQKLTLQAGYFHSQFAHEFETLGLSSVASQPLLTQTLALRTQGLESSLHYQPFPRVRLGAGYSYLAALTEQSAEAPVSNPNLPAIEIGGFSALTGRRPFHRPPQTGSFLAEYSGSRLNAAIKGSAVSKSDDSTQLVQSPQLLLPNRNLSPGYTALDANLSWAVKRHITAFTDLNNLTNNRHAAPIGFVSTPFLFRAGLRIRVGGE